MKTWKTCPNIVASMLLLTIYSYKYFEICIVYIISYIRYKIYLYIYRFIYLWYVFVFLADVALKKAPWFFWDVFDLVASFMTCGCLKLSGFLMNTWILGPSPLRSTLVVSQGPDWFHLKNPPYNWKRNSFWTHFWVSVQNVNFPGCCKLIGLGLGTK